jgi:putative hydrolase of the HAD superfamily
MIKNIIFDLGNVIIKNVDISTLQHFCTDIEESELLKKNIFGSPEWKMLDKGLIEYDEVIKVVKDRMPEEYTEKIEKIMNGWFSLQPINQDTVKIAQELKKRGYKIYVLSNMAKKTYEYFKNNEFFKICNGIVISSIEGLVKPNMEIFNVLLDRYNIKAEESILIDDDDTNRTYETAKEIGFLGRRVIPNNSEDISNMLKEYGITL